MIKVEYSYLVNSPVEFVFAYIGNPLNDQYWQASCRSVELDEPAEVICEGTRYHIKFQFLGRDMSFMAVVTNYEPGRYYAYETLSGPMQYKGSYRFTRIGHSTQIDWTFEAETAGIFGIIPRTLLKKVLAKQVEGDIGRLMQILGARRGQQWLTLNNYAPRVGT